MTEAEKEARERAEAARVQYAGTVFDEPWIAGLYDALTDLLAETAPTSLTPTREHHPVGAYLPVGQLDGDCSCGKGPWPCPETPAPTQRFDDILDAIAYEAIRSIEKHGEQGHLPMGTGPTSLPLDTYEGLQHPFDPGEHYPRGLRPVIEARHLANMATLDTKAHSQNEGGDGTVTWWHILREEVFEAAAEDDPAALRAELVQVAAVAVKMIDALALDKPDQDQQNGARHERH